MAGFIPNPQRNVLGEIVGAETALRDQALREAIGGYQMNQLWPAQIENMRAENERLRQQLTLEAALNPLRQQLMQEQVTGMQTQNRYSPQMLEEQIAGQRAGRQQTEVQTEGLRLQNPFIQPRFEAEMAESRARSAATTQRTANETALVPGQKAHLESQTEAIRLQTSGQRLAQSIIDDPNASPEAKEAAVEHLWETYRYSGRMTVGPDGQMRTEQGPGNMVEVLRALETRGKPPTTQPVEEKTKSVVNARPQRASSLPYNETGLEDVDRVSYHFSQNPDVGGMALREARGKAGGTRKRIDQVLTKTPYIFFEEVKAGAGPGAPGMKQQTGTFESEVKRGEDSEVWLAAYSAGGDEDGSVAGNAMFHATVRDMYRAEAGKLKGFISAREVLEKVLESYGPEAFTKKQLEAVNTLLKSIE